MELTKMSKIKDYSLDHPTERFSGWDKPKENPYKLNQKHEERNIKTNSEERQVASRAMRTFALLESNRRSN